MTKLYIWALLRIHHIAIASYTCAYDKAQISFVVGHLEMLSFKLGN